MADTDISILNGNKFQVTQFFGENPDLYRQWGLAYHNGIDIVSTDPADWDIECVEPGTVEHAGWKSGGYGNVVIIYCQASNREWQYLHLDAVHCNIGDKLETGSAVGKIGNTGNSFGAHLHLGVKYRGLNMGNGVYGCVDPLPILNELDDAFKSGGAQVFAPAGKTETSTVQFLNTTNNEDDIDMGAKQDLENKINAVEQSVNSKIDSVNSNVEVLKQTFDGFVQTNDANNVSIKNAIDSINENQKLMAQQVGGQIQQMQQETPKLELNTPSTAPALSATPAPAQPASSLSSQIAPAEEGKNRGNAKKIGAGAGGIGAAIGISQIDNIPFDSILPRLGSLTGRQIGAIVLLAAIMGCVYYFFFMNKPKK